MAGRDFSRVSFLVVDDNDFARGLVKVMLQAFRASDVREALDGGRVACRARIRTCGRG